MCTFAVCMPLRELLLVKLQRGPLCLSLSLYLSLSLSKPWCRVQTHTQRTQIHPHHPQQGKWGVVDVDDCCAAARYLADRGEVDPARLCIDGGSAGGYTTLACLAFRCVCSQPLGSVASGAAWRR